MVASDRYQAYMQNSVLGSSPTDLITALYEGALEATQEAQRCLKRGDILGRSKAVSKTVNIVTELTISLNHEKGGALSQNLKQLYRYIQSRLFEAHVKKSEELLKEVERLLTTLLGAWRVVAAKTAEADRQAQQEVTTGAADSTNDAIRAMPYSGYFCESADTLSRTAFTA